MTLYTIHGNAIPFLNKDKRVFSSRRQIMINVLFFLAAYFVKEANPHHERLDEVIKELSEDVDTDVRAFLQIPQMYDSDGEPINDVSVS